MDALDNAESEGAGKFKTADEETLKGRRILKVRRKVASAKKSNPFAGVSLSTPTEALATETTKEAEAAGIAENKETGTKERSYLDRLIVFYEKFKPDKVDSCEKLLTKYAGNEEILFGKLEDKYGVHPDDLGEDGRPIKKKLAFGYSSEVTAPTFASDAGNVASASSEVVSAFKFGATAGKDAPAFKFGATAGKDAPLVVEGALSFGETAGTTATTFVFGDGKGEEDAAGVEAEKDCDAAKDKGE